MKIKQEHFERLKAEIDAVLQKHKDRGMYERLINVYEFGKFGRAAEVYDLQKRFCWDCLYAIPESMKLIDEIYKYANDDHIFTALKKICPKVERKY